MKKLAAFLVLIFLSGVVSTYAQQYRQGDQDRGYGPGYNQRYGGQAPRDGACFYMTAPFRGNRFCVSAGQRLANLPNGYGDNISSIQIFGNARVRIFNDSNYQNGSREVWRTIPDLRNLRFRDGHTWNNRISSIIVTYAGGSGPQYGQPYPPGNQNRGYGPGYNQQYGNYEPRDGACFYMTAPFQGQRFCMSVGDRLPNLPGNFGDNISSIEIFGNARVRIFNDSNYSNGSREVRRSVRDLRNLRFRDGHTWNNRISSIMVMYAGGPGSQYGQPYPPGNQVGSYGPGYNQQNGNSAPRGRACFYMTAPFQGQRFCMSAGQRLPNLPDNFGDNISSIEIFGDARVRIFNDSNYRNGSREVGRSVRDLRNLPFRDGHTWNNRISSIIVY